VAVQALAAVLGGTQSLHCNGRDEALALPTEESARIALRTQQIIASESGVANTVDPAGGSIEIEAQTDRIERDARTFVDGLGGVSRTVHATEAGFMQREIQDAAYAVQQEIDAGTRIVVGVNRYAVEGEEPSIETLRIDPGIETRQVARVRRMRSSRDQTRWRSALDAVGTAARGRDNLVPPILAAVEAQATVGEIADAMRAVFGEHRESDAG
jgi:methylmalonyl-CoA mutase N-terminal domain/subunit